MENSYTIIYQGNIEPRLIEHNIDRYMVLNDRLAIVYTDENFDTNVFDEIEEISVWKRADVMSSLIKIGDEAVNGQTAEDASGVSYINNNPYIDVAGRGVLIAIIDSGIDYLHPDFINDDGTSKIISIWDQEGSTNPPPEGAVFGSEFTREEINQAIASNNGDLTRDDIGTGTIAAGIASGRGNLNPLYRGVARESELVVVKLRHYEGAYTEGRINYLNTDFLAAIKYVCDVSQNQRMLTIINLTVAESSRSSILTNLLDTFDYLRSSGVVVVSGAGNEGNTNIHYEGNINIRNESNVVTTLPYVDIIIEVGEQKNLLITLNTNGPGKGGVSIISPSGEISYVVEPKPDEQVYRGTFNIENSAYEIKIIYPWLLTGNQETEIMIYDIKPGTWTLRLYPGFVTSGEFDVYLPNGNLIPSNTRFLDPNSFGTITLYALTEYVISVGVYNDRTNSLWIGSSKGSSIRTRAAIKPDIIAPGVDIISTYKNSRYIKSTGSGISSSLTCGILALLIEYIAEEGEYSRSRLFTSVLKTYLMLGATRRDIYTYPNDSQGFGILNLQRTIESIANKI
ncbi:bile acid germinant receptor pseudoprotease CspC [Terrisporobacter sp.]